MRRRLRKEIRALWPYWLGFWALEALFLVFAFSEEFHPVLGPAVILGLAAAAALLGVAVFGSEFGNGTMERLLSEPISRNRVWNEKTLFLAVITGIVPLAAGLIIPFEDPFSNTYPFVSSLALTIFLISLGFGPLLSLVFRQTHLAFWGLLVAVLGWYLAITVLDLLIRIPFPAIWLSNLLPRFLWHFYAPLLFLPASIAGFFLGRRKFLRLEL